MTIDLTCPDSEEEHDDTITSTVDDPGSQGGTPEESEDSETQDLILEGLTQWKRSLKTMYSLKN